MSKDGGPAFPHMANAKYQGIGGLVTQQITENGMSLRDWFAGQALTALSRDFRNATGISDNIRNIAALNAALAYLVADAMLKERAK